MRFHLPARDHVVMDWAPALYVIRVDGRLGAMTLSAFPGMTTPVPAPRLGGRSLRHVTWA
jgi:hypothetical protein